MLHQPILLDLWAKRKDKDSLWLNFKYKRLTSYVMSVVWLAMKHVFCQKHGRDGLGL